MMTRLDHLAASPLAQTLRRGVTWWLSELREMVPRRWTERETTATVLLLARDGASVLRSRGQGKPREAIALPGSAMAPSQPVAEPGAGAWDEARAALRKSRSGSIVRLDPSVLLETSTTLPMAAERSLRFILQNQLDRLLPLPPESVRFDYLVTERAPETKTVTVRLLVTTDATIAQALDLAHSLGVTPRRIVAEMPLAAGQAAGRGKTVTFWHAHGAHGARGRHRLRRGLELLTLLLLVASYGVYLNRLGEVQAELRAKVAQTTKVAARARALSSEIAESKATLAMLSGHDQEMSPLHLIDELTRLLPDTAWVNQLSKQGTTVEIIGYADRVSKLIPLLEQHAGFGNTHLLAPITPSPDGKTERFDVGFTLSGGGGS